MDSYCQGHGCGSHGHVQKDTTIDWFMSGTITVTYLVSKGISMISATHNVGTFLQVEIRMGLDKGFKGIIFVMAIRL